MTKPMLLAEFTRLPSPTRASVLDGLSGAIDVVAQGAVPTHHFLRYQWYAGALAAYGGAARTILVEEDVALIALPLVGVGPALARIAMVPGCYWPFRSFPIHADAGPRAIDALLDTLARHVNALRIGPLSDVDPVHAVLERAREKGWAVLGRFVADSFLLDVQQPDWPRGSTLRRNRHHEKALAAGGTLEWHFATQDWERAFDALATIEGRSWLAAQIDGRDAKFSGATATFWREVVKDPVLARMLSAAILRVDGVPAAFSFDLDCGATKYVIANSFDQAFARHSPGKLLSYRDFMVAQAAGVRTVDWGGGDSAYKATAGATQGPALRDWLLVRPGLPARFARALHARWAASGNRPS